MHDSLFRGVTGFWACMLATIKGSLAKLGTYEDAYPVFSQTTPVLIQMCPLGMFLIVLVTTHNRLLIATAVAAAIDPNFTSTTQSFMALTKAAVLLTGHDIAANLATAPARFVISINTAACR